MTDSDSGKRPSLRRADLRRLRDALTKGRADVPGTVVPDAAPAVLPTSAARTTPPASTCWAPS